MIAGRVLRNVSCRSSQNCVHIGVGVFKQTEKLVVRASARKLHQNFFLTAFNADVNVYRSPPIAMPTCPGPENRETFCFGSHL